MIFLASPGLWQYSFGAGHPLRPERLWRTIELLQEYGALQAPNVRVVPPRMPGEDELALFHTPEYIAAVRALSRGENHVAAERFGFGPGDNPVYAGMYQSVGLKVGGALQGAEMLLKGQCDIAYNYSGGTHHAAPAYASGFCIFNDVAVAITWLVGQGQRVAYVDLDAHHGDGVQNAFYHTDRVLTISLHQDGHTLFPGTGFAVETGQGAGEGYSVNLPLPPSTGDEDYLWAFRQVVPPLLERFKADIVVTQLGADAHYLDPLSSLQLTTHGQVALYRALSELAPRWLAFGGGGYSLDATPRAWTLAFSVMAGLDLPDELPAQYRARYGGRTLRDAQAPRLDEGLRQVNRREIEATVAQLKRLHRIA